MYNALEKDMDEIGSFIHFNERNLDTFGIRIYNLLFLSCNLFEIAAKEVIERESGVTDSDMNEWKKSTLICQFSKDELTFIPMGFKFKPMEALGNANLNNRVLDWWKDYNSVKHNLSQIHKATLRNLIYALSSAGLLVSYVVPYQIYPMVQDSILFDGLFIRRIR